MRQVSQATAGMSQRCITRLIGAILVFGLAGCALPGAPTGVSELGMPSPAATSDQIEGAPPSPVAGAQQVAPAATDGTYLSNPGIGWQRDGEPSSPIDLPQTVAYSIRRNIAWSTLSPSAGFYDWSPLDSQLQQAVSEGEQYSFRVYSMAGEGFGGQKIPGWVRQEGATLLPSGEPDYSNCVYQQRWGEFINALRDRYDGNPNIAFIDISGYGNFNEWSWQDQTEWDSVWEDSSNRGHADPSAFQTLDGQARRRLADMFIGGTFTQHACRTASGEEQNVDYTYNGFRRTQLVMPYAGIRQSTQYVAARRPDVGFRYDCLGAKADERSVSDAAGDTWRRAPVVFELCSPDNFALDSARQLLESTHGSLVHDNSYRLDLQSLQDLMLRVGYRYVLKSTTVQQRVAAGGQLSLSMVWQNAGLAPAYPRMGQVFQLHVFLVPASGAGAALEEQVPVNIAAWMPSDPSTGSPPPYQVLAALSIPPDTQAGSYALKIAMLDARTGLPVVLGFGKADAAGRYFITDITITP